MAARRRIVAAVQPRPATLRRVSRDVREPLVGAGFCGLVFLVLLAAAYGSSQVRWLDAAALQGFVNLSGSTASWVTGKLAAFGNPLPVVLATVAFAAVAVARGRPRSAAVVVALVGLTSVSSQLLKPLLATARYDEPFEGVHVGAASLPSGHATAAMSLAIAAVLVVPAGARLLAGLAGAALALAVGLSVMISGWHFPSDVAAGYLLAAGWALVLVATRRAADLRWPERSVRGRLAGSLDRLAERTAP